MIEFCENDFEVIMAKSVDDYKVFHLSALLPHSFNSDNLGDNYD